MALLPWMQPCPSSWLQSRRAHGIDLKGTVVIFDEAHNVVSTQWPSQCPSLLRTSLWPWLSGPSKPVTCTLSHPCGLCQDPVFPGMAALTRLWREPAWSSHVHALELGQLCESLVSCVGGGHPQPPLGSRHLLPLVGQI